MPTRALAEAVAAAEFHARGPRSILAQREFIEALFEDVSDAVVVANPQRRMVLVNPAALRIFGYSIEELLGQPTAKLYADYEEFQAQGRARFNPEAEKNPEANLVEYRRANGEVFPGETVGAVIRNDAGEALGYIGVIRDISQRKKFELVLHRFYEISTSQTGSTDEKIQQILDLGSEYFDLPLGIVSRIEGETYTIDYAVSPNGEIAPGQSFPLGKTYCVHTLAADHALGFHEAGKSRISGHPCYQEFGLESYIGAPLVVDGERYGTLNYSGPDARMAEFSGSDLELTSFFAECIAHEIARRRDFEAIEEARRIAEDERRRAYEANEAKSRFLAIMSHELRTPMTGVLGLLDLLDTTHLDDEQRGYTRQIKDSAQTLLALLNDILDLSKIEADRLQIEEIAFDPRETLGATCRLFEAAARDKGLVLASKVGPQVPARAVGDPMRLRQVLSNLLNNAVKFSESGRIQVTVAAEATDAERTRLLFSVADEGPGIPGSKQAQIFEPFGQSDTSTTRKYGGTGLGLAICKQLVEAMGGDMSVDSAPGCGATFRFDVLVGTVAAAAAEAGPEAPIAVGLPDAVAMPLRVLVAEDNEINAALIKAMLEKLGHTVALAGNGREAVDMVRTGDFDIAVMDMQMPEVDGIQATAMIRKLPAPIGNLPIVALTADAVASNRANYADVGLTDFLLKPIDWQALQAALQRWGVPYRGRLCAAMPAPVRAAMSANGAAGTPILDAARLADLREALGQEALDGLLSSVGEKCGDLVARLDGAVSAEDDAAVLEALHALRGVAGNFGAARLAERAESWERMVSDGDLSPTMASELGELVAVTAEALPKRLLAGSTAAR